MVIACDHCNTRFHVDDERIPEAGVRVRCSRCRHAFFVRPSSAASNDPVHAAAAEAVVDPQPSVPPAGSNFEGPTAPRVAAGNVLASEEEESDWEFAVDPPGEASARNAEEPAKKTMTPRRNGKNQPTHAAVRRTEHGEEQWR